MVEHTWTPKVATSTREHASDYRGYTKYALEGMEVVDSLAAEKT